MMFKITELLGKLEKFEGWTDRNFTTLRKEKYP